MVTKQYEEAVLRPGKFEGEARYVPYFWEKDYQITSDELEHYGYCYRWHGYWITCYKVLSEDKRLFPELSRRKVIKLCQIYDGFVAEVR